MENAAQQWGRRALDFVDAVERLSAPEIIQLFEAEIKACGFHAYIMAGLPSPGTALPDLTVAHGWPAEWFEMYTRENFGLPVEINSMSTVAVIVDINDRAWSEICSRRSVPGSTLVWQGLPAIERRVIGDPAPAI